jgi:hypothetical protein
VRPRDIQILTADDLGQVGGQDEVGVRMVDRQVKVRHLGALPWLDYQSE